MSAAGFLLDSASGGGPLGDGATTRLWAHGRWDEATSGGSSNHASFCTNPQYVLMVVGAARRKRARPTPTGESSGPVRVVVRVDGELRPSRRRRSDESAGGVGGGRRGGDGGAVSDAAVGVTVALCGGGRVKGPLLASQVADYGGRPEFRRGHLARVELPLADVLRDGGEGITLVPSTYGPGMVGRFTVEVTGAPEGSVLLPLPSPPLALIDAAPESLDYAQEVLGEWAAGCAGGCLSFETWQTNPQYVLTVAADDPQSGGRGDGSGGEGGGGGGERGVWSSSSVDSLSSSSQSSPRSLSLSRRRHGRGPSSGAQAAGQVVSLWWGVEMTEPTAAVPFLPMGIVVLRGDTGGLVTRASVVDFEPTKRATLEGEFRWDTRVRGPVPPFVILPCTYYPQTMGAFRLIVAASVPFGLEEAGPSLGGSGSGEARPVSLVQCVHGPPALFPDDDVDDALGRVLDGARVRELLGGSGSGSGWRVGKTQNAVVGRQGLTTASRTLVSVPEEGPLRSGAGFGTALVALSLTGAALETELVGTVDDGTDERVVVMWTWGAMSGWTLHASYGHVAMGPGQDSETGEPIPLGVGVGGRLDFWSMGVELAFADACGGYRVAAEASVGRVLSSLTGGPTMSLALNGTMKSLEPVLQAAGSFGLVVLVPLSGSGLDVPLTPAMATSGVMGYGLVGSVHEGTALHSGLDEGWKTLRLVPLYVDETRGSDLAAVTEHSELSEWWNEDVGAFDVDTEFVLETMAEAHVCYLLDSRVFACSGHLLMETHAGARSLTVYLPVVVATEVVIAVSTSVAVSRVSMRVSKPPHETSTLLATALESRTGGVEGSLWHGILDAAAGAYALTVEVVPTGHDQNEVLVALRVFSHMPSEASLAVDVVDDEGRSLTGGTLPASALQVLPGARDADRGVGDEALEAGGGSGSGAVVGTAADGFMAVAPGAVGEAGGTGSDGSVSGLSASSGGSSVSGESGGSGGSGGSRGSSGASSLGSSASGASGTSRGSSRGSSRSRHSRSGKSKQKPRRKFPKMLVKTGRPDDNLFAIVEEHAGSVPQSSKVKGRKTARHTRTSRANFLHKRRWDDETEDVRLTRKLRANVAKLRGPSGAGGRAKRTVVALDADSAAEERKQRNELRERRRKRRLAAQKQKMISTVQQDPRRRVRPSHSVHTAGVLQSATTWSLKSAAVASLGVPGSAGAGGHSAGPATRRSSLASDPADMVSLTEMGASPLVAARRRSSGGGGGGSSGGPGLALPSQAPLHWGISRAFPLPPRATPASTTPASTTPASTTPTASKSRPDTWEPLKG